MEKLCVFCQELDFDYDAGGGGCPTCGYGGEGHAAIISRYHKMDWSEPYLKLEQYHKSLKDALNQERYEDAKELLYLIMNSTDDCLSLLELNLSDNA